MLFLIISIHKIEWELNLYDSWPWTLPLDVTQRERNMGIIAAFIDLKGIIPSMADNNVWRPMAVV